MCEVGVLLFIISFFVCSTVEDDIIVDPVQSPEIIDDFDLGQDEVMDIKDKEVNKQKLRRRIEQYKVSYLPYYLVFMFTHELKKIEVLLHVLNACRDKYRDRLLFSYLWMNMINNFFVLCEMMLMSLNFVLD